MAKLTNKGSEEKQNSKKVEPKISVYRVIHPHGVNVRKETSLKSEVLKVIPNGRIFESSDIKEGFVKVGTGWTLLSGENIELVR